MEYKAQEYSSNVQNVTRAQHKTGYARPSRLTLCKASWKQNLEPIIEHETEKEKFSLSVFLV